MMGRLEEDAAKLFYEFSLDEMVPADHLLRKVDRFLDFDDIRAHLKPFYSHTGRPSVDPVLSRELKSILEASICAELASEKSNRISGPGLRANCANTVFKFPLTIPTQHMKRFVIITDKRSAGTLQTLRSRLPWPHDTPLRILAIDGGGIKGILPAQILAEIEQDLLGGEPIASRFDVIAGTSTGGIIALGLGLGLSASEILKLYLERGGLIFPNANSKMGKVKQFVSTRYDATVLEQELQNLFGERVFGEAKTRLVIPAFNHDTEPHIFKTDHHPDFKKDCRDRAVTVARATSAALSYLDGLEDAGRWFWDGGLFANNPVMMALVDMMTCYDLPRENIQIVLLGCAAGRPKLTKKHLSSGKWGWRSAVHVTSALQSHDALGQAGLLIGRQNLIRIDAELREPIELDDYDKAARDLPAIGERLFSENAETLRPFVGTPVAPRDRFYSDASTKIQSSEV